MAQVLCFGSNKPLEQSRKMLLQRAGHDVVTVMQTDDIEAAFDGRAIDVAIIGQSIPPWQKRRIRDLVRRHCSTAKILELYPPFGARILEDADDWLEVPPKVPTELTERVSKLALKKSAASGGA